VLTFEKICAAIKAQHNALMQVEFLKSQVPAGFIIDNEYGADD